MEFHINKNSTLPVLKLELINDGRNDFRKFNDKIQNANVFFTMTDVITGVKRVARKLATIEQIEPRTDCTGDQFYLVFQFNQKQTANAGRFAGQFEIDFLDGSGVLLVPIREELFINVLDGSIKK